MILQFYDVAANLPASAAAGALLLTSDTNVMYAGTGSSIVEIGGSGGSSAIAQGTLAYILSSVTPNAGLMMWATDVEQLVIGDGSRWWLNSGYLTQRSTTPDIGAVPFADHSGYGSNYVSNKALANCNLGANTTTQNGGLRYDPVSDTVQIYLDGAWWSLVDGTILRDDPNTNVLEYKFFGAGGSAGMWLAVSSGNSILNLAMNGVPIVRGYKVCMGALPTFQNSSGGTF